MTLAEKTKKALKELGLSPKKKFGQHFMIDAASLEVIAESLSLEKGETVLEIGPGLGFLTDALLEKGVRVLAVEKDRNFAAFLQKRLNGSNFEVKEKDVLSLDLKKDLGVNEAIKVAGNIPYNITSPLLEWLVDQRHLVSEASLTVQWEVALRLTACPGNKVWGALSVFLQFYSEVELVRKIGKVHFYPSPKVDSAVVKLVFPKEPRFRVKSEEVFFKIVRKAFQKRRKTILNALEDPDSEIFSKKNLTARLAAAGLDGRRRPETFSISEWVRLVDMIY